MHRIYWGRIPVNLDQFIYFCKSGHSHTTRAATRGGYIWQLASTVEDKRSLKHLGPKIWVSIHPSLYDISPPAFKSQLKDRLVNACTD